MVYASDMYTTDQSVENVLQLATHESTIISIMGQVFIIKISVSLWFTEQSKHLFLLFLAPVTALDAGDVKMTESLSLPSMGLVSVWEDITHPLLSIIHCDDG